MAEEGVVVAIDFGFAFFVGVELIYLFDLAMGRVVFLVKFGLFFPAVSNESDIGALAGGGAIGDAVCGVVGEFLLRLRHWLTTCNRPTSPLNMIVIAFRSQPAAFCAALYEIWQFSYSESFAFAIVVCSPFTEAQFAIRRDSVCPRFNSLIVLG